MIDWSTKKTLVTGGASFVGSHLVYALIERGTSLRIVDNLSSGKLENMNGIYTSETNSSEKVTTIRL